MNKIKIIIHLETEEDIIGVKEDFATYCEKYGDVTTVDVKEDSDVVEVKHGKWVEEGCHILVCSKCNFEYDHSGMPYEGLNYCPNCGAKMDGDNNGNG